MDSSIDADPAGGPSLLVVDDDELIRALLAKALQSEGFARIQTAASAKQAREELAKFGFDVVVTDISMPDGDGIELMQWAKEHTPGASWMVLTGHATLDAAVRALQLGAFDFVTKPLEGLAGLRNSVRNALDHRRLVAERDHLLAALSERNAQLAEHIEQLEAACSLLDRNAEMIRVDLHRAAFIQQALLPREAPRLAQHRIHAIYRPCENVAGDLYDIVRLDDRHLALVVADAAGHGLSAAMLAVLFHQRLPRERTEIGGAAPHPAEILRSVNHALASGLTAPGLFVTAACCLLDTESGRLEMASAGHPPLLVRRRDGRVERFLHTGPALGLYPEATFTQHTSTLAPGDRLLLHTDGLYEGLGRDVDAAEERLAALFETEPDGEALIERILRDSRPPGSDRERREDDLTLVVLDAAPGRSILDNGALPRPPERVDAGRRARNDVLIGDDAGRVALCVRGRGSWRQSGAFHRACAAALDAGRPVTLDLTLCEHLDSTFLGTIHELSERAERDGRELRVQGVMPPVEKLFEELGLRAVLERSVSTLLPLPQGMKPLAEASPDAPVAGSRILSAHERLAALNRENAREFDPLLEQLRRELAAATPPGTR